MSNYERDLARKFLKGLAQEEDNIRRELASDRLGILFRAAVNELDWYVWNYMQQHNPTEEQDEQFYLVSLGVAKLIWHSMQIHQGFQTSALTFKRQNGISLQVLKLISYLGFIQHGHRVADSTFVGLSQINLGTNGRFEFFLPERIIDHGGVEDDVTSHFSREIERLRNEQMQVQKDLNIKDVVNDLHSENVFVFHNHFMGYEAHPLLDEYYFQIAWSDLRNTPEFGSFNELREFGGVSYLKYTLAAAFVNSLCLKHEAFCDAMVHKHPDIRMEDILTVSAERAPLVNSIRQALNIFGRQFHHYSTTTEAQAEQIYETIAITPRNVDLLNRSFPALPCILEFSQDSVVKCLSGRYRQMEFLLESLRHAFPADYNNHQQLREASLQNAVEELLGDSIPNIETRRNIMLRGDGNVLTDVDLVLFDLDDHCLLLVQLKFQDRAGGDFRIHSTRMERFRNESVRWLETVSGWLESVDEQTLRSTFRLRRGKTINKIRKLVLGRHHAHALRSVSLSSDTSFATWDQLVNTVMLLNRQPKDLRTLDGLHTLLRRFIVDTPDRYHRDQDPVEYVLDSLRFLVAQTGTDPQTLISDAEAREL